MNTTPETSPTPPFEVTFRVEPQDIDELGHVNNIVYLRWVQEIAILHWQAVASMEDQEQLLWVVTRHEIDYKAAAYLNEEIQVKTWIGPASALTFERNTLLSRASDGEILAKARTLWVPVNRETKKPQRLRAGLRALFSAG